MIATEKKDMQFHEAANIFPFLGHEELSQLADDIRTNKQRESIKLLDGKIIDGRNRYKACLLASVKPRFEDIATDDPVSYVLSMNLHRRHLTVSQAAMCAGRAKDLYEQQAKQRQSKLNGRSVLPANLPEADKGDARDKAGKAFGIGGRTVDHAARVLEKGTPELIEAVDKGRVAVSTAAVVASDTPEVQRQFLQDPKRNRIYDTTNGKQKLGSEGRAVVKKVASSSMQFAQMAIAQLERIQPGDEDREKAFEMVLNWILNNKGKSK